MKSIGPACEGHGGVGEESKACSNDMPMTSLSKSIVFMIGCVRGRGEVKDDMSSKKGIKFWKFSTIIRM